MIIGLCLSVVVSYAFVSVALDATIELSSPWHPGLRLPACPFFFYIIYSCLMVYPVIGMFKHPPEPRANSTGPIPKT